MNNTTEHIFVDADADLPGLDEVLKPLREFLRRKFSSKDTKLAAFDDSYGVYVREREDGYYEARVYLYLEPAIDTHVVSAIITLLDASSPCVDSNCDVRTRPLNFTLHTFTERWPDGWMTVQTLCVTLERDIDSPVAVRQIEKLIEYLDDERNLLEVDPRMIAYFGATSA